MAGLAITCSPFDEPRMRGIAHRPPRTSTGRASAIVSRSPGSHARIGRTRRRWPRTRITAQAERPSDSIVRRRASFSAALAKPSGCWTCGPFGAAEVGLREEVQLTVCLSLCRAPTQRQCLAVSIVTCQGNLECAVDCAPARAMVRAPGRTRSVVGLSPTLDVRSGRGKDPRGPDGAPTPRGIVMSPPRGPGPCASPSAAARPCPRTSSTARRSGARRRSPRGRTPCSGRGRAGPWGFR